MGGNFLSGIDGQESLAGNLLSGITSQFHGGIAGRFCSDCMACGLAERKRGAVGECLRVRHGLPVCPWRESGHGAEGADHGVGVREAGCIVFLKGESGSGKTTLLRLIQAMELLTEGQLLVCVTPLSRQRKKRGFTSGLWRWSRDMTRILRTPEVFCPAAS